MLKCVCTQSGGETKTNQEEERKIKHRLDCPFCHPFDCIIQLLRQHIGPLVASGISPAQA